MQICSQSSPLMRLSLMFHPPSPGDLHNGVHFAAMELVSLSGGLFNYKHVAGCQLILSKLTMGN
jgi:hypothetical protein